MPIYEYQCQACGENTEILQKVSDPPATECPSCHKPQLKKMLSASAFHLKGSGWYVTDFKNKSEAKKEQPTEKDKAKTQTENKTKTDDKSTTTSKTEKKADKK